MTKEILYFDMDNVLVDFLSALEHYPQSVIDEYNDRYDEIPGIFSLMKPMPGGLEAFRKLFEYYDVYILSSASWINDSSWSDKAKWIKKHLGDIAEKRLILSHHKNLNLGKYLIDDRPNNGAKDFTGEWIHFGSEKFPNWDSVVKYLLKDK